MLTTLHTFWVWVTSTLVGKIVASGFISMLPIPFIILFIRKIFAVVRKWSATFEKLISKVEAKAYKHQDMIDKYAAMGLFILTAIPLPGTGAWTASLLATLMDMRLSRAFFPIALGVVGAGTIMAILSYGVAALIV